MLQRVILVTPTRKSYFDRVKSLVTSKGQVTIPKELRDRFGIEPGAQVDFFAADDGIRLRKVIDRKKSLKVFGCLKAGLQGRSVADLLTDLRGPVELPAIPAERGSPR